MKFALIDSERREPQPTLAGQCPACSDPVLAKCGTQRVWHWAHKGRLNCDPWWEPETEWHRHWKNLFPISWQETVMRSEATGERHIADIRTPAGLVMEFQHSAISAAERVSRERFYLNMLWVVDCTRLKSDGPRIDGNLPNWRRMPEGNVETINRPESFLPRRWLDCSVPVLFDFDGLPVATDERLQNHLICLVPNRYNNSAVYFPIKRSTLVNIANNESFIIDWRKIHADLDARNIQEYNRLLTRYRRWR